jgi:hypothetical protein
MQSSISFDKTFINPGAAFLFFMNISAVANYLLKSYVFCYRNFFELSTCFMLWLTFISDGKAPFVEEVHTNELNYHRGTKGKFRAHTHEVKVPV